MTKVYQKHCDSNPNWIEKHCTNTQHMTGQGSHLFVAMIKLPKMTKEIASVRWAGWFLFFPTVWGTNGGKWCLLKTLCTSWYLNLRVLEHVAAPIIMPNIHVVKCKHASCLVTAATRLYQHTSTRCLCTLWIACISIYNANVVIIDMCPMACWCYTALAGVIPHVAMFFHMIVMCGVCVL